MTVLLWAGVLVFGGLGSVLRFLVDRAVSRSWRLGALPLGTLTVNISGAIVLGFITGLAIDHRVALLAGTATIGAYTTFSTWIFETHRLGEERQKLMLATNIVVSLVLGIAAAMLGKTLGAQL